MHVNLDISLFSPQYSLDAYPQCSFRSGPSPVTRVAKGLTGWLTWRVTWKYMMREHRPESSKLTLPRRNRSLPTNCWTPKSLSLWERLESHSLHWKHPVWGGKTMIRWFSTHIKKDNKNICEFGENYLIRGMHTFPPTYYLLRTILTSGIPSQSQWLAWNLWECSNDTLVVPSNLPFPTTLDF